MQAFEQLVELGEFVSLPITIDEVSVITLLAAENEAISADGSTDVRSVGVAALALPAGLDGTGGAAAIAVVGVAIVALHPAHVSAVSAYLGADAGVDASAGEARLDGALRGTSKRFR